MTRPSLRVSLLAVVAVVAFVLAVVSWATGALSALEGHSLSARFSIRGSRGPPASIVIVALDPQTLAQLREREPIRRRHFADLLDALHRDGARLIGVDLSFGQPTDRADDNALLAAVARDGPILIGSGLESDRRLDWPAGRVNAPGAVLAPLAFPPESAGGVARMYYGEYGYPTFPVRAAQMLRARVPRSEFPGNVAWIDFRGKGFTITTKSMIDVLRGSVARQELAGKLVLVGSTDPLGQDFHQTVAGYMFGIELQANALSTVLDGFPLHALSGIWTVLLLAALAALPALLSLRLSSLLVFAASLLALGVFLLVVQLAFDSGTIVPVPDPILAVVLATAGAIAADTFVSRRQLRNLQQAFDLAPREPSFFISYRRGPDEFVANTLRDQLAEKFGPRHVFLDTREIDAGVEFPSRIDDAIHACRAMLVVIGPSWVGLRSDDGSPRLFAKDDWVRREIERGLAHQRVTVVPIVYGGATMPTREQLPPAIHALCDKNAWVLTGRDLRTEIDELVQSLERGRLRESAHRTQPVSV